jgi:hypothetical protein
MRHVSCSLTGRSTDDRARVGDTEDIPAIGYRREVQVTPRVLGSIALVVAVFGADAHGATRAAGSETAAGVSRYNTYFILQGNSSGSAVTDQRIRTDLEAALDGKGWVDVPPNEAEAVVVAHAATGTTHTYQAFYAGWGGWPWQRTPGASAGRDGDYKPGTLVVDIFDAQSKQALWSGFATGAAADIPDKSGHAADGAIVRMFRDFPRPDPIDDTSSSLPRDAAGVSDAPRVIVANSPAWLIRVDGEPVYRAIDDSGLERVVNARPFIVRDADGVHYLKIADGWMEAYSLTGMWAVAGTVPLSAGAALSRAVADGTVDLLAGGTLGPPPDRPTPIMATVPSVYVSTTPAALIVTEGEPTFAPLDGTSLLAMTNTSAHVFRESTDQELYALLSGEWYRAWTTAGPWEHLSRADLPADLTQLPGLD